MIGLQNIPRNESHFGKGMSSKNVDIKDWTKKLIKTIMMNDFSVYFHYYISSFSSLYKIYINTLSHIKCMSA